MRSPAAPVTIVTTDEYLVVNGIVASPYGGVNHHLAHIYYHLHRLARPVARAFMRYTAGAGAGAAGRGRGPWAVKAAKAAEQLWAVLSSLHPQRA